MRKYIGDRDFYRRVAAVLMPILIQQVITSFVSLLDNIMVGQVGTEPMSGVAIVNQLFFVYYLCVIGGLSGAGILTAQFSGKGDREGIRHSVRVKLILGIGICLICAAVLLLYGALVFGGLRIASRARSAYASCVATGLTACLGLQTLLNVGGCTKAIPLTGIPLPLLSHGGSSLVTTLLMAGLLLAISDEDPPLGARS